MRLAHLFLLLANISTGLKHTLYIKKENRRAFSIETFGFVEGGAMNLTVTGFSVSTPERRCCAKNVNPLLILSYGIQMQSASIGQVQKVGFRMRKVESENAAQQSIEVHIGDILIINMGAVLDTDLCVLVYFSIIIKQGCSYW